MGDGILLNNLQVLRAFAALGVVFYHTGYIISGGVSTEFQGVKIFFCISGFIMTYITRDNQDQFFVRRLLRVVPIYWIATLLMFFLNQQGLLNIPYTGDVLLNFLLHNPKALLSWVFDHSGIDNQELMIQLAKSLLFIPYSGPSGSIQPILSVGWTLNLEIYFYVLFVLALKISHKYAPLVVVVAIFSGVAAAAFTDNDYANFYGGFQVLYFAFGIISFYVWRAFPVHFLKTNRNVVASCTFLFIVAYVAFHLFAPVESALALGVPIFLLQGFFLSLPVILLLVILACEHAGLSLNWKFGVLLGNASYSLYLFHVFVIEILRPFGEANVYLSASKNAVAMSASVCVCVCISVLIYRHVELPINNFGKEILRRNSTAKRPKAT